MTLCVYRINLATGEKLEKLDEYKCKEISAEVIDMITLHYDNDILIEEA